MAMSDREKIIKGLECCRIQQSGVPPICEACPYADDAWGTCKDMGDLLNDAYEMLKAQEPRVMTIGDLYGEDMGYYERKDEELVYPILIARGGLDDDKTVGIILKSAFEIKADCDLMNITWRIWTAYPTMAQREAVKWDAAD